MFEKSQASCRKRAIRVGWFGCWPDCYELRLVMKRTTVIISLISALSLPAHALTDKAALYQCAKVFKERLNSDPELKDNPFAAMAFAAVDGMCSQAHEAAKEKGLSNKEFVSELRKNTSDSAGNEVDGPSKNAIKLPKVAAPETKRAFGAENAQGVELVNFTIEEVRTNQYLSNDVLTINLKNIGQGSVEAFKGLFQCYDLLGDRIYNTNLKASTFSIPEGETEGATYKVDYESLSKFVGKEHKLKCGFVDFTAVR